MFKVGKLTLYSIFCLWFLYCSYTVAIPAKADTPHAVESEISGSKNGKAMPFYTVYLPIVSRNYPRISPFGVEVVRELTAGEPQVAYTADLDIQWVRLNAKISWRQLQPVENGPINWELLKGFETELLQIKSLGMTAIVIVDDYPYWAVKPYRETTNGPLIYSSCAALQTEHMGAFAEFMRQLVQRYHTTTFDVHHWELGNEVDVAPTLVAKDNIYGCWGDPADPYYGGRQYGEMLKIVTPAIKQADPNARVWIGGLLLDSPNSLPAEGKPENFFEGMLTTGAGPYFDIVAYHAYPAYREQRIDYDLDPNGKWLTWGGSIRGKARFLRAVMERYNITKPVIANEVGLTCPEYADYCAVPSNDFYQAQADTLVRSFVRGLSDDVSGYIWYSLEDPGWRHVGLLDRESAPRLAYYAYKELSVRINKLEYDSSYTASPGVEGYIFKNSSTSLLVIWSQSDTTRVIAIPQSRWIAAYDIYGQALTCTPSGQDCRLQVDFSPVYIVQKP